MAAILMRNRLGSLSLHPQESEVGAVRKPWRGRIHVALVYPNTYAVGISNLGFQSVYKILNEMPDVLCERAFLPSDHHGSSGRIRTMESDRPLTDFDVIAFSISFENDYPNVLTILGLSNLPLLSNERGASHPLVLGGGVACFLNPEPIAAFFDLFLLGEAERLLAEFVDALDPGADRKEQLKRMALDVPGAYVPGFYHAEYKKDGTIGSFTPDPGIPGRVVRVVAEDITRFDTCSTIVTPHVAFESRFLVEVGRGCPHGCRFCSAGYVYRPPRFRTIDQIENAIRKGAALSDRVGLVGAAVSDLPGIGNLCARAGDLGVRLGFSSLRSEQLTPELVSALVQSGVKTATIAPDAGSERLRRVINKGIRREDILNATEMLVRSGVPNLKLYFMVGLPTETDADIDALVDLVREIKSVFLCASRDRKRIGRISVSINGFVPKPVTPFQWCGMDAPGTIRDKMGRIRRELARIPNVSVKCESPRHSYLQAVFSRGDRRVSQLLVQGWQSRWNWVKALAALPTEADFYVLRKRSFEELLPWDFIDTGIRKRFLWNEYRKALDAVVSEPCPMKSCLECRICRH